jgi:signal peptidase I
LTAAEPPPKLPDVEPAPDQPLPAPASPVLGVVAGSVVLTAVWGYVALGRWRRALAFAGVEALLVLACVGSALAILPWAMWAAVFLALAQYVGTLIDVGRLARVTPPQRRRRAFALLPAVAFVACFQVAHHLIKRHLAESYVLPSGSMAPTVEIGDRFLADKRSRPLRRGDLVVFASPQDPQVDYVKRIVALAGDTVAIRKGELFVNDIPVPSSSAGSVGHREPGSPLGDIEVLQEQWEETMDGRTFRVFRASGNRAASFDRVTVPPDHVFVLGDNRDNSHDSRAFGPIRASQVRGRLLFVWWSKVPGGPVRWQRFGSRL